MPAKCDDTVIHIYRRNDTQWYIVVLYQNGRRLRRSGRALDLNVNRYTPEEAENIVRKQLGIHEPKADYTTIGGLLKWMIPRIEREGLSKDTVKEYRIALEHLQTVTSQHFKTAAINRSHVALLQEAMLTRDKPASPYTINKTMRHLQGIFSRLVDDELLDRNPFRKFRKVREDSRDKALTLEQAKKFLEAIAADTKYSERAHVARILIYTGLRLEEVMRLPRSDIDLDNKRMLVTLSKSRGKQVKYWLPLHENIIADVRELLKRDGDAPFYVCHPATQSHWIKEHLIAIGCPGLNCHGLRHTFVTLSGKSGEPLWRIQSQTGHSTIKVTEGYFHATLDSPVDPHLE